MAIFYEGIKLDDRKYSLRETDEMFRDNPYCSANQISMLLKRHDDTNHDGKATAKHLEKLRVNCYVHYF
jgi:hypothetical protein